MKSFKIIFTFGCVSLFYFKGLGQNDFNTDLDKARQLIQETNYTQAYKIGKNIASITNMPLYADALTVQANAAKRMKRFEEASTLLLKVLALRTHYFGENALEVANAYHNIANLYLDQQLADKAKPFLEKVHQIRIQALPPNHQDLIKLDLSFGEYFYQKHDFKTALSPFLKALSIPAYQKPLLFSTVAICYLELGDPVKSLLFCKKAIDLSATTNTLEKADIFNNAALCYRRLNKPKEAINYLEQATTLYSNTKTEPLKLAATYLNLGILYADIKSFKAALYWFEKGENQSISIFTKANICLQKGVAHLELAHYEDAQQLFNKGISLLTQHQLDYENQSLLAELWLNQGILAQTLGNSATASSYFKKAETSLPPPYSDAYLLLRIVAAQAKAQKYEALHAPNNTILLEHSLALYDKVFDILQTAIDLQDEKESVWYWQRAFNGLFGDALELCFLLKDKNPIYLEQALNYAEKSKNIWLRRQQNQQFNTSPLFSQLLHQRDSLKWASVLLQKNQLVQESRGVLFNAKKTQAQDALLFDLAQKIAIIEQNIPKNTGYMIDTASLKLGDIQRSVAQNQAILNFHATDTHIWVFILTSDKVDFIKIEKPQNWINDLQSLYDLWIKPKTQKGDVERLSKTSFSIYNTLFTPVEKYLNGKKLLTFIPDTELTILPFEALNTEGGKKENFHQFPYLLRRFAIQYQYNLSSLSFKKRDIQKVKTMIFAPEFKGNETGLKKLNFNTDEGQKIQALTQGDFYEKHGATKVAFLKDIPKYNSIHLATHGIANMDSPNLSYIAFSQNPDSLSDDAWLSIEEIYALPMTHVDLMVLSACETNVGQYLQGEGVLSLARAFSAAGVQGMVTSLWSIDDQSTSELMVAFYTHLKQGKSKAEALQSAKLDFIDNHRDKAHPFYWAALTQIGDNKPLPFPSKYKWFTPLSILGVLALFLARWLFIRKRQAQG